MQAPPEHEYYGGYAPPKKPNYLWLWILVGAVVFCGCVGLPVIAALLFPVFSQARLAATRTLCLTNTKQIALATIMYSTDFDDRLPDANRWGDQIYPYSKNRDLFDCPAVRRARGGGGHYGYAANADESGKSLRKIPDLSGTIWTYETADLRPNASGKPAAEPPPGRHGPGRTESFLDGHAKWIH